MPTTCLFLVFHRLAGYDIVLTTYNIVSKEVVLDDSDKNAETPVKDETEEKESDKVCLCLLSF